MNGIVRTKMISLDQYLLEFISGNWLSLYVLITALKGIAIITPNVKDDKIITLFINLYETLKTKKPPDKIEDTK